MRMVLAKRAARVAAVGVLCYFATWAVTATFGVSKVVASVSSVESASRVEASSPYPFVVQVQVSSAGGRYSARHVWLGSVSHEFSREVTLSPFIYTLF